jgi:hypothetical protein
VVELKNAAFDLMAAESPKQKCQIHAACARSVNNAAGARTSLPQRGGEISHSRKTPRNQFDEPTDCGTKRRPRLIFNNRYLGPRIQPLLCQNDL